MTRFTRLVALAIALAAPLVAPTSLSAQNTPGNYKDWQKVDSVQIMQSFKLADYSKIVVLPLEKSGVTLPAESDNTYAPTKAMIEASDTHFFEGLQKGVADVKKDMTVEKGAEGAQPKTLLVRGKLLGLQPGSKAARAFGGFGAGAASATIAIEIVDASNNTVLAKMTHQRRAGTGAFGGSYDKVMSKAINEVGETFGKGLKGF